MNDKSDRKHAWDDVSRSRSGFPAKTNPNVKRGAVEEAAAAGGSRLEFAGRTNPQYGQSPLTEDQKELATRYLPMARALARQLHARWHTERDEIESVAFVALVEAARSFDRADGTDFSTYARYHIVGAVLNFSKRAGMHRHLQSSTMRGPWGKELEVELYGKPVGMTPDLPIGAEFDAVDAVETHLKPMSSSHAWACRLIYLEGKSQDEVAEIMSCTKSYVSKLHREAMDLLQERFRDLRLSPSGHSESPAGSDKTRGRDAWCPVEAIRGRSRMPKTRALATAC